MITLIVGEPGVGKTSLNACLMSQEIVNYRQDYLLSCRKIDELNSQGYCFEYPKDGVLTYANFKFVNKTRFRFGVNGKRLNPWHMALPNDEIPFDTFPPYSKFHIMEGQVYWNSRRRGLRDCVSRFFENHRHNHFDIYIDVQRGGLIDANIREIAGRILEVQKSVHKKDFMERIKQTTFFCYEFDSWSEYEKYLNNGKDKKFARLVTFEFEGCIFDCYNSFENETAFFENCREELTDDYFDDAREVFLQMPKNYYEKAV
jgi:hypothetical protein